MSSSQFRCRVSINFCSGLVGRRIHFFAAKAIAIALTATLCATPVFAETLIFNTDNSVFARLLQQLPVAQSDFVTAVGNRVAKQPIFIFVPGILGSKLMDSDGEVIWGKTDVGDLFKTSDKLAYDPDEKVTTNTLADYDIMVTDLDVYGKALSIINDMNMTDVRHLLLFSYDWRKDIRAAARDLQERMTGEWAEALKGRKVIFLAHSMGGLVTTWWYHHYFKNAEIKHTFGGIEQVIFLGTPHSGSPAMLFLMLDRYTANLDPGWISKKFQSRVFGDLNRAAFSFPSIYQILPHYTKDRPVIKRQHHALGEESLDHFQAKVWRKYDLLKWQREQVGDNKKVFYDRIAPLLRDGGLFQQQLAALPEIDEAVYFYGEKTKTPGAFTIVHTKNDEYKIVRAKRIDGDGRVPTEIASNAVRDVNPVKAHPLGKTTHGDLPKAQPFIAFLVKLKKHHERPSRTQFAVLARGNATVENAMLANGALLKIPLDPAQWSRPEEKQMLELNQRVLALADAKAAAAGSAQKALYRSARNIKIASAADIWRKQDLYAVATALSTDKRIIHHAANNLGHSLIEAARPLLAKSYLERAIKERPFGATMAAQSLSRGKAYNNLGTALQALGQFGRAISMYEFAKGFGNISAATNLTNLRNLRRHQM